MPAPPSVTSFAERRDQPWVSSVELTGEGGGGGGAGRALHESPTPTASTAIAEVTTRNASRGLDTGRPDDAEPAHMGVPPLPGLVRNLYESLRTNLTDRTPTSKRRGNPERVGGVLQAMARRHATVIALIAAALVFTSA